MSVVHYTAALALLIFSVEWWKCSAYPDGAPDRVCSNGLVPGHGRKEHGVSPYRVSASSGRYSANKPIRVRIESLTDDTFKGFVVQAQDSYGDAILEGDWRSEEGKPIRKCGAVTHRDSHDKQSITLTWTPKHGSGSVTFVATIAKTKKLYYHNIKADVVGGAHKPSVPKASSSSSHLFVPVEDDDRFGSHLKITKFRERPSSSSPSSSKHEWSSSAPSVFTSWSMEAHHPPTRTTKSAHHRPSAAAPASFSDDFFARPSSQSFLHRPFPPHHKSQSFPPVGGLHVEELEFSDASPSFAFVAPPFRSPGQGTRFHFRH